MQRDFILLQLSEDNVMSSVGRFGKSPPPRAQSPSLQKYRAVVHGARGLTWLRQPWFLRDCPTLGLLPQGWAPSLVLPCILTAHGSSVKL